MWSFEWAINTDSTNFGTPSLPGLTTLNALTYELRLDSDPTAGTAFLVSSFDPINRPYADHAIGFNATPNGGGTVASDPVDYAALISSKNVAQNSWNYEFFNEPTDGLFLPSLAAFDPSVAGTYRIELEAFFLGQSVASTGIDIVVDGGTAVIPLPAGFPLLIGALGGLALMCRRKS